MAIQNSNLRPSFVNEVVKIVEDETIVRSNLKSVFNVYSWIEEYGRIFDLLDHLEQGLCADLHEANLTTLNQERKIPLLKTNSGNILEKKLVFRVLRTINKIRVSHC
ncbi:hypothetical protein AVEN_51453-1 [Araneus ventricosus]|uniref:Uncharacterized protein n=1 Tax=Araneus ventricosus TaxID=182803 RepID=A0A4Y2KG09_ARAVE|nr:hypothetical protein AVEN_51453-1 [Araneus ventricosus]